MVDGHLDLIKGSRSCKDLSHSLYVNDVMIFFAVARHMGWKLSSFFLPYMPTVWSLNNASTSTFYVGGMSQAMVTHIASLLNFNIRTLSFSYLGVKIFRGRPKIMHFQAIADIVKVKLPVCKDFCVVHNW